MTEIIPLILILGAAVVSITDMKKGFLICVATGFLQDPLRKMIPNEPVSITMLVGVMLVIACIGARIQGVRLDFRPIHAWDDSLRTPLKLFSLVILFQCIIAFMNTGSLVVPVIGLIAYFAPLPALVLAYQYARNERRIRLFLQVYVAFSIVMLAGVYLSVLGYDWDILKPVGSGLAIYTSSGKLLLPGGFFRASEVAAWHAGASICFLIMLSTMTKKPGVIWLNSLLVLALLGAMLLTGRRKMIMEIAMFIPVYALFIAWFRGGSRKLIAPLAVISVLVLVATFGDILPEETTEAAKPYLERTGKLKTDSLTERLLNMSVYAFEGVISKNGFFGSGAGTGSQGAQHFLGGKKITGANAEGGVAKVLAELGVPGICVFVWFMARVLRYLVKVMNYAKKLPHDQGNLVYGFMAFLVANSVVFVTASQIYGDVFVLLVLGWLVGISMATPRLRDVPLRTRSRVRKWGEGTPLPAPAELSS